MSMDRNRRVNYELVKRSDFHSLVDEHLPIDIRGIVFSYIDRKYPSEFGKGLDTIFSGIFPDIKINDIRDIIASYADTEQYSVKDILEAHVSEQFPDKFTNGYFGHLYYNDGSPIVNKTLKSEHIPIIIKTGIENKARFRINIDGNFIDGFGFEGSVPERVTVGLNEFYREYTVRPYPNNILSETGLFGRYTLIYKDEKTGRETLPFLYAFCLSFYTHLTIDVYSENISDLPTKLYVYSVLDKSGKHWTDSKPFIDMKRRIKYRDNMVSWI
jgi:hypothetical protein